MLQFLYYGTYKIDATPPANDARNGIHPTSINGEKESVMPSHFRTVSFSVKPPATPDLFPATDAMMTHIFVYGIARLYNIADLRALALKKFKKARVAPNIEDLLQLIKAVYHATDPSEDVLKQELLALLLADWP